MFQRHLFSPVSSSNVDSAATRLRHHGDCKALTTNRANTSRIDRMHTTSVALIPPVYGILC